MKFNSLTKWFDYALNHYKFDPLIYNNMYFFNGWDYCENMVEWWDHFGMFISEPDSDLIYYDELNFYKHFNNMVDWWDNLGYTCIYPEIDI